MNHDKKAELWRQLVTDGLCYDGDVNTTKAFGLMSKRFGSAWMDYVRAAWECRDEDSMSVEEFCRLNGGVPATFVDKNLRGT